jgi:uncharacterized protein with NRDE domain
MCTVTYLPPANGQGYILTSNRDEKVFRPAIPPALYNSEKAVVCFPKDSKAGGSWIAMNNQGRLCCLLNGAFVAHQKQDFHTRSRGIILTELASATVSPEKLFEKDSLHSVEPFTIVTIDQQNKDITFFNEFIWDGTSKHFRHLDKNTPQLWSSVTLYSEENRKLRKQWFQKFLESNNQPISAEKILSFHSGQHTSDAAINLVMEREGGLKTVSITQVFPVQDGLQMRYFDLIENSQSELTLNKNSKSQL